MNGRSAMVHTKTNSSNAANANGRLDSLIKNKISRHNTDDDHMYLSSLTAGLDQVAQANAPLSPKVVGSKDADKLEMDRDLNSGVALS